MDPSGWLVAAEPTPGRYPALVENVVRWGMANQALMRADALAFARLPNTFDFLLTDVPCSGEGMFRKDPTALKQWRPALNRQLPRLQRQILHAALHALKPGGYLLYTTCTFAPEENELNVQWALDTFGSSVESVELPELLQWGIVPGLREWNGQSIRAHTYRFYPHRVPGEGFFLALLRKTDSLPMAPQRRAYHLPTWQKEKCKTPYPLPSGTWGQRRLDDEWFMVPATISQWEAVLHNLPIRYTGRSLEGCQGRRPAHAVALTVPPPEAPHCVLDQQQALAFLRGEIPCQAEHDDLLDEYQHVSLGWLYRSGTPPRLKNALPSSYRLRRRLPLA